jgi:hypothetical protein
MIAPGTPKPDEATMKALRTGLLAAALAIAACPAFAD